MADEICRWETPMLTRLPTSRAANRISPILETAHAIVWTKRHLLGQLQVPALEVLGSFISPDDLCFDVGAHGGSWSVKLARLVSKGHVYAFEALPYYSRVLDITLSLLRIRNVTVVSKAVTDGDRNVPLVWQDSHGGMLTGRTHIAGPDENPGHRLLVQGICLDSFCRQLQVTNSKIRFVKCDVEGNELAVLRGATEMIARWHPIFFLEIWQEHCARYGYDPEDVFDFLAQRDYESYVVSPAMRLVSVDSVHYEGKGDVLFLPRVHLLGTSQSAEA